MEIKSKQHAVNRKAYLQRMLSLRPAEAYYMGDSIYAEDAVRLENEHNDRLADMIQEEIAKCDKYFKEKLTDK